MSERVVGAAEGLIDLLERPIYSPGALVRGERGRVPGAAAAQFLALIEAERVVASRSQ